MDLPQLVLSLIANGGSNLHLYSQVHSGNESDRDILPKIIEQFEYYKNKKNYNKEFIYVADSALYSKKYLLNSNQTVNWITRVPESVTSANSFLEKNNSTYEWQEVDNNYKITSISHAHGGVKQRWILVYSRTAHYKELTTLKRRVQKEADFIHGRIRGIKNIKFHCEEEIKSKVLALQKNHPLFKFEYFTKREIIRKNINGKRKVSAIYKAHIQFSQNKSKIETLVNKKGRFILATNIKSTEVLSNAQIFTNYREQKKVESCFKFIKDKSFLIKDFYLKKPERIQALMAVISLTLFIYNLGQFLLRKSLTENSFSIPNQKGTMISNPTLKWAFQLLQGVTWLKIKLGEKVIFKLSELSSVQKNIINCIAESTHIYGFS